MNPHVLDRSVIQATLAGLRPYQHPTSTEKNGESDRPLPDWNFRIYQQLASTNLTLWDSIRRGAHTHTVIIAQEQTQGKGQRGREWVSAPGGLYLSAALRLDQVMQQPQLLTLSIAWGIATHIRTFDSSVGLKWPNDLVIDGRKLGGILIETRFRGDRLLWLCVGVGINWNNPVPATGITLYSLLNESDTTCSINHLAAHTLMGIETGVARCQTDEAEAIARDYERLLANQGQRVTWLSPSGEHQTGIVTGVSLAGELKVQKSPTDPQTDVAHSDWGSEVVFAPGRLRLGYRTRSSNR